MKNETNQLEFLCLGSGSSGNCYLLGRGNEYVMIECGLPYRTIVSKMADHNITIDNIKALVVSHSHNDHALAVSDFESLGIPVFMPARVPNFGESSKPLKLTEWLQVRAFPVEHDVDCYGFIFATAERETVLFVTDTKYFESKYFNYSYTYLMLECNHIRKQLEAIMNKAVAEGNQGKVFKFTRQAKFHLSLAGVKKILSGMNLEKTKAIILLHLSKECCNDDLIKKEVAAKFGKRTLVCYRQGGIN